MSGNHSRNKGYRFEAELVNAVKEHGLEARRIPLSGAAEGFPGDVEIIAGFDGKTKFTGELKRRKNLPEWIVKALSDHDFMAMREDRGSTLVVLRFDKFLELLQ